MNTELLRESIDRATADPVTAPDLARLERRGRRRSAARVGGAVLATLAVVAGGTYAVQGIGGAGGSDEPPASIRTQGPAATYITWPDKVHFDGRTATATHVRGDALGMSAATYAGFVYVGSDDFPYLVDRDGSERRIGPSTNPHESETAWTSMASSPDQRYAVWASQVRGGLMVSLFDAEAGEVVARRTIDCGSLVPGGGTCEYATAVTDGVVYLTAASRQSPMTVGWDPSLPASDQVYRVTDPGTQVTAAGAKTVLVIGNGAVYDHDGDPVGDDWAVVPVEYGGSDLTTALTADGRWRFTFSGREETSSEDTVSAVDVHTGESVELVANAGDVRAEDDGSVLVMTNGNGGTERALLDCDLPSGECAVVDDDIGRAAGFAGSDS